MSGNDVHKLAEALAGMGDAFQAHVGETEVIKAAVAALVATHPDPEAFAAAFRRSWQLLGSQNQDIGNGEQALRGIGDALSFLEDACPAPLRIRPPRE